MGELIVFIDVCLFHFFSGTVHSPTLPFCIKVPGHNAQLTKQDGDDWTNFGPYFSLKQPFLAKKSAKISQNSKLSFDHENFHID